MSTEVCLQKVYNEKAVDKMYKDRIALINKFAKLPKDKHTTLKTLDKFRKEKREEYRKFFCNPGCKNTVFEVRTKTMKRPLTSYEMLRRKEIFGKNKDVLEDSFYKGLDAKTRKKLKLRGAISGCMSMYKNNPPL